jgi:hypothetical protein
MGILRKLRELIEVDLFRAELEIECPHSGEPCSACRDQARADRW